jgi:haloacetate dehalogenase
MHGYAAMGETAAALPSRRFKANVQPRGQHYPSIRHNRSDLLRVERPGVMDDFETLEIQTGETTIFARWSGSPVLLLHGFPQTHLMWRSVAPMLARNFVVVCPDLRGYGRSGCPDSTPNHAPYAKRAMAQDMLIVMEQLGFARFSVAGHDRGGRVAYRMALDHPDRVARLAVLDILPTATVWNRAGDHDSVVAR